MEQDYAKIEDEILTDLKNAYIRGDDDKLKAYFREYYLHVNPVRPQFEHFILSSSESTGIPYDILDAIDFTCSIEGEDLWNRNVMKEISITELKGLNGKEGIIFQGCGGDLAEWESGVTELFINEEMLLNGSSFKDVYSFEYNDATNILFMFDGAELNLPKLAMWRLGTQSTFGCKWLSDYLYNNFGISADDANKTEVSKEKPDCALIGEDGNIYNLMGIASRTLKRNGMDEEASEMCDRIISSDSYEEALGIIDEYVNITDGSEQEDMDIDMC